jgi:hypothetical protein
MFVLGEAGSGKTTLLSWLAVMAARSSFTGDLAAWNNRVPFLIKLRRYVDTDLPAPEHFLDIVASTICDLMPRAWVHRILSDGKALLLVDGLDELPAHQRRKVRQWLYNLLQTYPDTVGVVTARPTAANGDWLAREGFSSVTLNRMGPSDVKALITQWHTAVRDAGNLPCAEEELPEYERDLLLKLDATPHLQGLATNPLLCAMLCALNLDRHKALPPDRMSLYKAALDMLLQRRDVERGITAEPSLPLGLSDKLQLLQYLAWRMSLNNKAEIDKEQAISRFRERLLIIQTSGVEALTALEFLISRSGVIREPVVGRIDFVHRTFQEYLTAREVADNSDVGFLVDHAHLDTWQETIIMAVGHANKQVKGELLTCLLERANTEARYRRRIRLLAAACLETVGILDPNIRQNIMNCLADLVPPRRKTEARSLATAGSAVFPYVPTDSTSMPVSAARAMVSTLAMIGGKEALDLISQYATDSRNGVVDMLVDTCEYFEPKQYAERVLRKVDFDGYDLNIYDRTTLDCFRHVPNVRAERIQISDVADLSIDLHNAPPMTSIWVDGSFEDVSCFENYAESLEDITLWSSGIVRDRTVLGRLPLLKKLRIGTQELNSISLLASTPQLSLLWLPEVASIEDLSAIEGLAGLHTLRLRTKTRLPPLSFLREMRTISEVELHCAITSDLVAELADCTPWINGLTLLDNPSRLENIEGIVAFAHLKHVVIISESLLHLEPLAELPNLSSLHLDCFRGTDLSPIANLRNLRFLHLALANSDDVDLSVLNGLSAHITILNNNGMPVKKSTPKTSRSH